MNNIFLELSGIYPRSEALIAATRDYDRKRISLSQLQATLKQQQDSLCQFQKKLGIKVLADGQLNWQDIFRPFGVFCREIEPGTLTRFADTNTFFRQPVITGRLSFDGSRLAEYFYGLAAKGNYKATLPAPFFLARVADDQYYHLVNKLALAFTEVLISLINKLKQHGYSSFQLYDPCLGYLGANKKELEIIRTITKMLIARTKAKIYYQTSFSASQAAVKALIGAGVQGIGIDFFNTDIKKLPNFQGKIDLLAGCLDSRSSLVEDVSTLVKFLREAIKIIKPRRLIATSNIDLQFVPQNIAQKKLTNLRQAIELVKNKI